MISLIDLYNQAEINNISQFCTAAQTLNITQLSKQYVALKHAAPRRAQSGKAYFPHGRRLGQTTNEKPSNRREEHLAIALYNSSQAGKAFQLPNQQELRLIDYQTPFKAKQDDKGIGKIDLFAVIDKQHPTLIELKIEGQKKRYGDTPLRAFLEGLAYCALFEANMGEIIDEANHVFNESLKRVKPKLLLMAPARYWKGYLHHKKAGSWLPELHRISREVQQHLKIESQFIALENVDFTMGVAGKPPQLQRPIKCLSVTDLPSRAIE